MVKNNRRTAFIAHSFEDDESVKRTVKRFKDIFSVYFDITTGEEPSIDKSISDKVRNLIKNKDVFIGIITKRKDSEWNTSAWVLQEAVTAIDFNKPVILLVEKGIKEKDIGMVREKIEYISFDPDDISACIPKVLKIIKDIDKKSPENSISFPYKFREVINRFTIYSDGRVIYDRRCILEVLSDNFRKVVHGIGINTNTPKITVLKSCNDLKTTKISDRFTKDQCLFWRVFEPQNIILDKKDVLCESEWKDEDLLKGYKFSLNFGKFPVGSIIEYSYGFSCKGLFPWTKRQMENGELYERKTNKLSDWMEIWSEVDKLTIIIQFDHDYELKGTPELVITTREGEKIAHNYKFEKEDSLFYETYKVTIGRTIPGFKYIVEWKPEIL